MNLASLLIREQVIKAIRVFFETNHFHEVITPVLNDSLPLEPTLYSFRSQWKTTAGARDLFLTISPEATLKKMLAAGLGNCYSLGKCFRNLEATGPKHNPEFLMLEWYREDADYQTIIRDTENLISHLSQTVKPLALPRKWLEISLEEALRTHTGLEMKAMITDPALKQVMSDRGYNVGQATWEQLFDQLFLNEIEPKLPKTAFFLTDFPARLSPLCQVNKHKPYLAERFEVYMAGMELGNGNTEKLNAQQVLSQFQDENQARTQRGETTHPVDLDFIKALKQMQHTGKSYAGIGLGVDRLAMIFAGANHIHEVEPFCL